MARGVSYACYCPFRPKIENQLYREIDDQQFILQALASDGVNLKLVSKNTKVKRDGSAAITLNCIHLEHVVIRVKKTQSDNKE